MYIWLVENHEYYQEFSFMFRITFVFFSFFYLFLSILMNLKGSLWLEVGSNFAWFWKHEKRYLLFTFGGGVNFIIEYKELNGGWKGKAYKHKLL